MSRGQWVRTMVPGPSVWAVLFLVTVPAAILANATILEVPPRGAQVFWWTRVALPVAGAVAAARWTTGTGRRRSAAAFGSALLVATLTGALYLALSLFIYRWAIPLPDPVGGQRFLALPTATVGGALGYGLGLYGRDWLPTPFRFGAGIILAVLGGYLILPTTDIAVMHGRPDHRAYGVPGSRPVQAPAAGRYGVVRTDFEKTIPDCQITGPGLTGEPATPLTVPVNASHDGTSEIWVAVFSTPSAGSYVVTCDVAEYSTHPLARGVSPVIRTWPAPVIVLLGALPGLIIIGDTARRRRPHPPQDGQPRSPWSR